MKLRIKDQTTGNIVLLYELDSGTITDNWRVVEFTSVKLPGDIDMEKYYVLSIHVFDKGDVTVYVRERKDVD